MNRPLAAVAPFDGTVDQLPGFATLDQFVGRSLMGRMAGGERSLRLGVARSAPPLQPEGAHRRLRILVVDDHVDGAETLAAVLRLAGHYVRVTHDGRAALEQARRWRPEMVLLDLDLESEPDGYEVAIRLRSELRLQSASLVAVTGLGAREDRRRAHEAGFDFYLLKPVDPSDLCDLALAVCGA
jgi:CheY-like chemotaxis protein